MDIIIIMSLCLDPNHRRIVKNKLTSCQALAVCVHVCVCGGGGRGGGRGEMYINIAVLKLLHSSSIAILYISSAMLTWLFMRLQITGCV